MTNKDIKNSSKGEIVFVGDSDFISLFAGLGFKVFLSKNKEEFVSILESLKETENCLVIAGAGIGGKDFGITEDEIELINPDINIMFLSSGKEPPDKNKVKAVYKQISERASGVDLTRKL